MKNTKSLSKLNSLVNKHKELLDKTGKIVEIQKRTSELQGVNITVDAKDFLDLHYEEYEYQMEYGRILIELPSIIKRLKKNNSSRQCVINNWDPKKNPCIVMLQFLYRDGQLNLFVFIRSSDIFRLPNDIITLCHILKTVSNGVKLEIGDIKFFITSLHSYI